ncbi:hypothetical protein [Armatimonas rosea]|uniref:Uncharacterized protein n=1 Tax=Armatimonas rosea TaxID=685828 RepID=A0A7W9W5H0_ARMRO|nr:hypothetical protein [Armatimonas rosea]MBB6050464.1 hypothetical protein [Armatimonas rosea]
MPLFVCVPPTLAPLADALGLARRDSATLVPASPTAVRRAWAQGAREVVCRVENAGELWALRPLALFAAAFGEPLRAGTFHEGLRAYGGLVASEWRTKQQGSLLLAHNPTDKAMVGSVFPAFDEREIAAEETLLWAHDFPLGPAENYLGAYAGLVKSDATLLTAQLRPDPFPGARVFVTGKPGEEREVSVFNAGPGEAALVAFGETPAVFAVGVSQVIAVPEALAPHLWLRENTTWLGPRWELTHAGALIGHTELQETTVLGDSEPRTAQLVFEGKSPESVWLNGVPVEGSELTLLPDQNQLIVRGEHGPAFVIPDGACFQVELTEWHLPTATAP